MHTFDVRGGRAVARSGLAATAIVATLAIATPDSAAASLRGRWQGATYVKSGEDLNWSNRVVVRIGRLRLGRTSGRVVYPPVTGNSATCHGPLEYLGRSPRGGYRFFYTERNSDAFVNGLCTHGRILLVPHGARLFMRDSDRSTEVVGGNVSVGYLYRR